MGVEVGGMSSVFGVLSRLVCPFPGTAALEGVGWYGIDFGIWI